MWALTVGLSSVVGVRGFESPTPWLVELQAGSARGNWG